MRSSSNAVMVDIGVAAGQRLGCKRYFARISPNLSEKFLCSKLSLYKVSVSIGYSLYQSSPTLIHEVDDILSSGGLQIFWRKSQTFYSVRLIASLNKKQRCRNFRARIFRDFARIFDKSKYMGMRLPTLNPQLL